MEIYKYHNLSKEQKSIVKKLQLRILMEEFPEITNKQQDENLACLFVKWMEKENWNLWEDGCYWKNRDISPIEKIEDLFKIFMNEKKQK